MGKKGLVTCPRWWLGLNLYLLNELCGVFDRSRVSVFTFILKNYWLRSSSDNWNHTQAHTTQVKPVRCCRLMSELASRGNTERLPALWPVMADDNVTQFSSLHLLVRLESILNEVDRGNVNNYLNKMLFPSCRKYYNSNTETFRR